MRIEMHVEELALEGFSPVDRYRIGEALQKELTRLLEERGMPGFLLSSRRIESIKGGSFEVAPNARADRIGSQVARTVYSGLNI